MRRYCRLHPAERLLPPGTARGAKQPAQIVEKGRGLMQPRNTLPHRGLDWGEREGGGWGKSLPLLAGGGAFTITAFPPLVKREPDFFQRILKGMPIPATQAPLTARHSAPDIPLAHRRRLRLGSPALPSPAAPRRRHPVA